MREREMLIFQSEEMVILFPEIEGVENDSMKPVEELPNFT